MQTIKFKVSSLRPLLMHNKQLADPTNRYTKELKKITSDRRRKNTEEGLEEIRRLEWEGGLYLDADGRPCLTEDVILSTIVAGSKKFRKGEFGKLLVCVTPTVRLDYDGPRDLDTLYADGRFVDYRSVKVGQARVMRCRPVFPSWRCEFEIMYDETLVDPADILLWLETAGERIGFGTFRPRFGLFEVSL